MYVRVITSLSLPILVTDATTDITSSGAKEHGTLQYKGGFGAVVDKRGFELWRFPSTVNDPLSSWSNEEHATYNDNWNIYSTSTPGNYGNWLELYLESLVSLITRACMVAH